MDPGDHQLQPQAPLQPRNEPAKILSEGNRGAKSLKNSPNRPKAAAPPKNAPHRPGRPVKALKNTLPVRIELKTTVGILAGAPED